MGSESVIEGASLPGPTATPQAPHPNSQSHSASPLYSMWSLLMELLALGGLLSGIHWKVNLGVPLDSVN